MTRPPHAAPEPGEPESAELEPTDPTPTEPASVEPEPIEPESVEPTDALVQIAFTVMGVLTRIAAEHDLSLTQLRVFGILRDRAPRMTQLADYLGLEKSTMSGLISRAEQRGLVRRIRSADDSRAWAVVMTEQGQAVADRIHRQVQDDLGPLLDQFGAPDRAALDRAARLIQPSPDELPRGRDQ